MGYSIGGSARRIILGAAICGAIVSGVIGAGVREASATITLQETVVPIDPALAAAGWEGVQLSFVSDNAVTVAGFDFKNNLYFTPNDSGELVNGVSIGTVTPGTEKPLFAPGLPIGITGPLHQAWTVNSHGVTHQTPTDASGIDTDSEFLSTSTYYSVPDGFTEDNNLVSGVSSGFGGSPLTNGVNEDGFNLEYGVGSQMTFAGVVDRFQRTTTMDWAFLIIPAGTGDVTLRGTVLDSDVTIYSFDTVLNPVRQTARAGLAAKFVITPAPEAGTLGVAALGAAGLLGRRRIRNR